MQKQKLNQLSWSSASYIDVQNAQQQHRKHITHHQPKYINITITIHYNFILVRKKCLYKYWRNCAIIMDYPSLFLESDSIQNVFSSKRKRGVGLPTQSEYKCKTCEYKTTKKELMRQHNVVKHSGHVNKCSDCDYAHYFPGKVRKHFNYVHLGIKRQNKTQGRLDCFKMDCKNTQREDWDTIRLSAKNVTFMLSQREP